MSGIQHPFPFDPSYGFDLDGLLAVEPPPEPPGFVEFWRQRYAGALCVDPLPELHPSGFARPGLRVWDLEYRSGGAFPIRGWVLEPEQGIPTRGFVLGHGYGGIEAPDFELPCADAVYLVPCFRGLCRSRRPPISDDPSWHVLHDIHQRDRYILGGCVEDLWVPVSRISPTRSSISPAATRP